MLLITETMISFLVHLQAYALTVHTNIPLKAEIFSEGRDIKKDTGIRGRTGNRLGFLNVIYLTRIWSWLKIPFVNPRNHDSI